MSKKSEENEIRKRAIFDSMSKRRQEHIVKKGYERWDPFIEPKDPIDIRRDQTHRTSQMLVREFLQLKKEDGYSNAYARGVLEMAVGLVNDDDRFTGMFEFSLWRQKLIESEKER